MSNDQLKYKVLSRLLNNEPAKDIVATEDVKHATVLRWNRELEDARLNGSVAQLMNMDQALLDTVIAKVEQTLPEAVAEEGQVVLDTIKSAPNVLATLQQDLVITASSMNIRIRSLAISADNVGELSMLAETLCTIQNAFFNKNSTQVNVQNNYDSSDRTYSAFLSDKPAAKPPTDN